MDQPQSQPKSSSSGGKDLEVGQLDRQIDSLLEEGRLPKSYSCKLCGKTGKRRCDIRQHIESIHITGFVHYCDVCGVGSRTRKHLSEHKRQAGHQISQQPVQNDKVRVNPEEIDETVKSMMEYGKYIGVSGSVFLAAGLDFLQMSRTCSHLPSFNFFSIQFFS